MTQAIKAMYSRRQCQLQGKQGGPRPERLAPFRPHLSFTRRDKIHLITELCDEYAQ